MNYCPNGRNLHAKHFGQHGIGKSLVGLEAANLSDSVFIQERASRLLSTGARYRVAPSVPFPTLLNHVGHVVELVSKPEMPKTRACNATDDVDPRIIIPETGRVVACVQNVKPVRNWLAGRQFPRDAVSEPSSALRNNGYPVSVVVDMSGPEPAYTWAIKTMSPIRDAISQRYNDSRPVSRKKATRLPLGDTGRLDSLHGYRCSLTTSALAQTKRNGRLIRHHDLLSPGRGVQPRTVQPVLGLSRVNFTMPFRVEAR